jgi:hypothetical protein
VATLSDALQYYFPAATMYLNVTLTKGNAFVVNETACKNALLTILNGCPPFGAPKGQELQKWSGSMPLSNDTGGEATFHIILDSPTGDS